MSDRDKDAEVATDPVLVPAGCGGRCPPHAPNLGVSRTRVKAGPAPSGVDPASKDGAVTKNAVATPASHIAVSRTPPRYTAKVDRPDLTATGP
jgi:hypothetical protein